MIHSVSSLGEKYHILTVKELHLKELLKLLVKTLRRESLKVFTKSIKPSNNKTGKNDKSISVLVRKSLNAMLKLEPNYAQHIIEIEKSRMKCFLFPALEITYKVMLTCSRFSIKLPIVCCHTVSFFVGC